jgi:glutathione S-transferase
MAKAEFHVMDAASWQPNAARDALKRRNPLARIPTLVLHDGTV